MKKKPLEIGGIAVTAALVGGWALAQSVSPGPGGFGPPAADNLPGLIPFGPATMHGAGMGGPQHQH